MASDRKALLAELNEWRERGAAVKRGDDWQNALTGLGIQGRDWRTATDLNADNILDRGRIDTIFLQDSLAARGVDALPDHAAKRGWKIVGVDGENAIDFQKAVMEEWERLCGAESFLLWDKMTRKDGGALILIGADDGQPLDMPLGGTPRPAQQPQYAAFGRLPPAQPETFFDPGDEPDYSRVKEIRHLHVLERWTVLPETIDIDPMSPNFGMPLYYTLLPRAGATAVTGPDRNGLGPTQNVRVHYSRVIVGQGIYVSERMRVAQRGWGFSVFQRTWEPIKNYRVLWAHIVNLFKHVSQTIVKFAGLAGMAAADLRNTLQARLQTFQLQRSTQTAVALALEDQIEEVTLAGLSGALDVLKYAQEDLAQAFGTPLTLLFGKQAGGLGKDDQSGMRNWYDEVKMHQDRVHKKPLTMIVKLIAAAARIPEPDDWAIEFMPLEEPSDGDKATADFTQAQADHLRVQDGVLDPEEVRETLRADPKNRYIINDGPAEGDIVANPPPAPDPSLLPPPKPGVPAMPPKGPPK